MKVPYAEKLVGSAKLPCRRRLQSHLCSKVLSLESKSTPAGKAHHHHLCLHAGVRSGADCTAWRLKRRLVALAAIIGMFGELQMHILMHGHLKYSLAVQA